MLAVLRREFKSYFIAPTGYIFMGFFLLLSGIFFALINLMSASAHYISVLANITFIFLFAVPILTMRLMSEDKRLKTDQLLLTSPLSVTGLVLGKYFAAVGVFLLTILITCIYPVIINFFGILAVWEVVGGYIGFFLLGSAFISVGLFVSSTTENQVVAAIITFSALLFIWLIDWVQEILPKDALSGAVFAGLLILAIMYLVYRNTRDLWVSIIPAALGIGGVTATYFLNKTVFDGFIIRFFDWFSLLKRFKSFALGIFDLSAIVYYLSFSAVFIFLTIRIIEKRRWS